MTTLAGAPTTSVGAGTRRIPALARPAGAHLRRWAFRGVLAFFVALILASYAVPFAYQLRGERLLVVTSGSMEPDISAGDAVVVRQISSASELRVGQVVTFLPRRSTQLVTHRIEALVPVVRRDPTTDEIVLDALGNPWLDPYIRTRGDANDSADADLTPASQVRGIVADVHSGWGYPLGWAHSPVGRLVLFGPPLLLLVTAEVLSRLPAVVRSRGRLLGRRRHDPTQEGHDHAPAR
jgi:signal peptidase